MNDISQPNTSINSDMSGELSSKHLKEVLFKVPKWYNEARSIEDDSTNSETDSDNEDNNTHNNKRPVS